MKKFYYANQRFNLIMLFIWSCVFMQVNQLESMETFSSNLHLVETNTFSSENTTNNNRQITENTSLQNTITMPFVKGFDDTKDSRSAFPQDWQYRLPVIISDAVIDENLSNFTLVLTDEMLTVLASPNGPLDGDGSRPSRNGGGDIRFSADEAGTQQLAVDIRSWNTATGDGELAVKVPAEIKLQMEDNLHWIKQAGANNLVVGSQARILYADCTGRTRIAQAFNDAIRKGEISAPIVLGRDHHDVSGTDSPYRETSNIYDGSALTADMAVQNFAGDSFRGATWVSLHNGGGVGWGEVINGGFGLTIDGSAEAEKRLEMMLHWDVNNGIARRSWAQNKPARFAIERAMKENSSLKVTLANEADEQLLENLL